MACDCENNACLELAPRVLQCGENIVTLLAADETNTWLMSYEFNGRWFSENIDVVDGEFVELPFVFNEQYSHLLKFYKADGSLFNDTCYTLDTSLLMGSLSSSSSPSSSGFAYANAIGNGTAEVDFVLGTPIVVFDGTQSYIQGQFTYAAGVITMTNGVVFYDGQPLTILYV